MLKREIKFENFDGQPDSETHYFNLSKAELLEMEFEVEGGFSGILKHIIDTKDNVGLVKQFKRIVLASYGKKSEDGKRFIKNDQLREEFQQTPAYDALFTELAQDENKAAEFVLGVIPRDLANGVPADQDKPTGPPSMPSPPTAT